ncbi:TolC family protein [Sphingobacterium bambusae]|uniref:TolC family protein n=1 Tax=Sphingobacterium bambusae TaxID=662858 RepID=A0ABW6BH08_9SPHI|nr:TolC family protein [Sphingobacterium bambusae]WPL49440.1 TolC family protein [Sphingobacterium bambusae]
MKYILMAALCCSLLTTKLQAQTPVVFTLEECVQSAISHNKKVKVAQLDIDASNTAAQGGRLNALPDIQGSVIGAYIGKPLNNIFPEVVGGASVSIIQPIYTGGKIALGNKLLNKAVDIAQEQKLLTDADITLDVEKAYWTVVQLKQKVILSEKFEQLVSVFYQDLNDAYEAGLSYKNDLLRLGVAHNEALLNIRKAKDGVIMSKLALSQLIGQSGNTDYDVSDSLNKMYRLHHELRVKQELIKRPELRMLEMALDAQALERKMIKSELLPTVGLLGMGSLSIGKNVDFTTSNNTFATYLGVLNVSIPIFDWGRNAKKVKEHDLKTQITRLRLEEAKEFVDLEIQQAWLTLGQSIKQIELAEQSLQQAEENLKLAQDRFEAGTIVAKDVQEAQVLWQQAYSNVIDAKVLFNINEAIFKRTIGRKNC